MIDLYAYDDFRKLLSDLYEARRQERPETTARLFAAETGFSNPGFYNDVVRGVRRLSREAMQKIISVYGWNSKQAEFFRLLVEYGQEKDPALREEIRGRLRARQSRSRFARLSPEKSRYYENIAYPLVRSSVDAGHFRLENELVAFWKGKLSPTQVRHALKDLLDWGIVRRSASGFFEVADKFVEPAPTMGLQVRRLNREWIREGEKALDTRTPEKRHISTMLLTVGPETHQKILERIQAFREELFTLAEKDPKPDRVIQLSLLYFPQGGLEDVL
jgi:uncharacterized protein (TIGR02147 family)